MNKMNNAKATLTERPLYVLHPTDLVGLSSSPGFPCFVRVFQLPVPFIATRWRSTRNRTCLPFGFGVWFKFLWFVIYIQNYPGRQFIVASFIRIYYSVYEENHKNMDKRLGQMSKWEKYSTKLRPSQGICCQQKTKKAVITKRTNFAGSRAVQVRIGWSAPGDHQFSAEFGAKSFLLSVWVEL